MKVRSILKTANVNAKISKLNKSRKKCALPTDAASPARDVMQCDGPTLVSHDIDAAKRPYAQNLCSGKLIHVGPAKYVCQNRDKAARIMIGGDDVLISASLRGEIIINFRLFGGITNHFLLQL